MHSKETFIKLYYIIPSKKKKLSIFSRYNENENKLYHIYYLICIYLARYDKAKNIKYASFNVLNHFFTFQ